MEKKESNWVFVADDELFHAVYGAISECHSQDEKWGSNRSQSSALWQAILTEEVGEVSREVLEKNAFRMRAELVQVAATALNWIKALDRREVLLEYK